MTKTENIMQLCDKMKNKMDFCRKTFSHFGLSNPRSMYNHWLSAASVPESHYDEFVKSAQNYIALQNKVPQE